MVNHTVGQEITLEYIYIFVSLVINVDIILQWIDEHVWEWETFNALYVIQCIHAFYMPCIFIYGSIV